MNTQDFQDELEDDLPNIIHCLTAPEAQDDGEEEYERVEALSSALQGWSHKYGDALLEEIEGLLGDMARHLVENCGYCEFNDGSDE